MHIIHFKYMHFTRLTDIENKLVVAKEKGGETWGGDWELGASRCKLSHLGWMSSEVLLYSAGNSI